jgi:hypothetical protein
MAHSAEAAARDKKIAELKRLIAAGTYETLEKLEDAVDAFLWSEQDRLQQMQQNEAFCPTTVRDIARLHPK